MKPFQFFFWCATILWLNCHAQKNVDPTPDHIAQAHLLKEQYPDDEVVILKSREHITFGTRKADHLVTVHQSLEEELMNISSRADIQKYVFYDNTSKVTNFSTRLRNSKVKFFPVKDEFYESGDIFYHDARVKYMNIDFPVKGYTYFYNLEKEYGDVKYFTKIALNNEYPVLERKISLSVPEWLELQILEFNFEGYEISKEKHLDPKRRITEYSYTIKNAASFPKEENAPGPSHFQPHLLIVAKSMTLDNTKITLFSETKQLYEWYRSLIANMEDQPDILAAKVTELTADATTDEEKIKNIFYWVQDNIRYIAFEDGIAGFKPDESQNVFKKRYGDCKGMANLTKQMLQLAGFDARLTWIGTKRIAYDYSIPSLAVDNHMICTLVKDGQHYFLDSTEKYNSFGEYAERIQNRPVLIENGEGYLLDKVPGADAVNNRETTTLELDIIGETLQGNVSKTFFGESRSKFLYSYNSLKTDKKEEALRYFLEKGDNNCTVSNISTSNLEDRDEAIDIQYTIALDNKVSAFDGEIYVDLEYGEHFKSLDLSKRKVNFEFPHKTYLEFNTVLNIPEGYAVQELPDSIQSETDDFEISVSFLEKGNQLHYNKRFIFKNAVIGEEHFSEWNHMVAQLNNTYQQQLVLHKTQNQTKR